MGRVSVKDVAREANVSTATVSRVINGLGGYSNQTEIRVNQVIQKLGYQVDQNAKALRTNITKTVAILLPDITNEYFALIARAIDLFFIQKGYSVLILDSNEDTDSETIFLEDLINKKVDGLIYLPTQQRRQNIKDYPIPTVYVDRALSGSDYLVCSDNEDGGKLAARELLRIGCKNILFLKDSNYTMPIIQRELGFVSTIKSEGVDVTINVVDSYPTYESTKRDMIHFLEKGTCDGIFASNDVMALSAIHVLQRKGIRVPEDVAVIGYDDVSLSKYSYPSITTIAQNTEKIGKDASRLLYGFMNGKQIKQKESIVSVQLIRRASTRREE